MKDGKNKILKYLSIVFFGITGLFLLFKTWFTDVKTFWTGVALLIIGFVGALVVIQTYIDPNVFSELWDKIWGGIKSWIGL